MNLDGLFQRPGSLAALAERAHKNPEEEFGLALRAFLDEYYAERNAAHRAAMLTERPRGLGTYYDAFLGALAEHLAWLYDLPAPTWSRGYGYGLTRPHFGGTERGKAYLLACGLPAFRERMIFLEAEALHRIGAPYPPACRSPRP